MAHQLFDKPAKVVHMGFGKEVGDYLVRVYACAVLENLTGIAAVVLRRKVVMISLPAGTGPAAIGFR
ncbi:MAG: hypothetical protein KF746_16345 [Chitinophagaceae bacterium]|nr:hypothetical protein [Chitinophagaceae bacterium]